MKIAVYLGSAYGETPVFKQLAAQLGTWIARSGHQLVYGGTAMGCMKVLATAVKENGGVVTGVLPQFMVDRGLTFEGLDETIVVDTMAQRIATMIELADAFVACPGGPGTLEEVSQVISLIKLDKLDAPVVFLNKDGFYDPLREQFRVMQEAGFWTAEGFAHIRFADAVEELSDILA